MRKTQYNLADSKREKTTVVNQVLDLVRGLNPPGRFLQKTLNGSEQDKYWIEIDDAKAMAKISQALREGAPAMRAMHGKKVGKRRSDSSSSSSPPRRGSKRMAKRSKTVSSSMLLSNEAISSAPLTQPPSLEDDDMNRHHDLLSNHDYSYLYHSGELDNLLDHTNQTSAATAAGGESIPFISPHPLIPFGDDYARPISEVANAIPLSQFIEKQQSRANNVTPILTSLPPPPISPAGAWDPLSFLPSTPKHGTVVEGMNGQSFFPLTPFHTTTTVPTSSNDANAQGQMFSSQKKQLFQREHSLDASFGSFSIDNESLRPYSLGPPQRGFSFGMIGGLPNAKKVDASSRHNTSSHSSSSSPNERKSPF